MSREGIDQNIAQVVVAVNSKDAEALGALYTDDARLLPPNHEMINGKKAIVEFWRQSIDAGFGNLSAGTLHAEMYGDVACGIGFYRFEYQAQGQAKVDVGKYTVIYKRQEDGSWKMHVDMFNSDLSL